VSFQADILRVFIASPGDLAEDRDEVENAIHEWNRQHAAREHVMLLPQRWEGAAARQGGDGQRQINEQQVQDSDVVLALLWTRLGQPTSRAASGTAEEIELGEHFGKPTHVLVCRRATPPDKLDPEEYQRLNTYINEVQKRGLTKQYTDSPGLRAEVNNALWGAVTDHKQKRPSSAIPKVLSGMTGTSNISAARPEYASNLGRLAVAIPGYPTDGDELDGSIRSLTAFADTLAAITDEARSLLAELVMHAATTDYGALGLSVLELGRRLQLPSDQVVDQVRELDRYGLASVESDEGPAFALLREEPANLDWPFWEDLREVESSTPGVARNVIVHLRFDLLDESSASAEGAVSRGTGIARRPDVRWSLERKGKNAFVLRNVGSETAERVRIPADSASAIARNRRRRPLCAQTSRLSS
jgi:hypothetical protein